MTLRNFENFRCFYFEMHVAINRRHSVKNWGFCSTLKLNELAIRSRRLFCLWKHKGCYVFLACCFRRTTPKFEGINWIITWELRWFSLKWGKVQISTSASGESIQTERIKWLCKLWILCFTSWPTTIKCGICRMNLKKMYRKKRVEMSNEVKIDEPNIDCVILDIR